MSAGLPPDEQAPKIGAELLRMHGIVKTFPGVRALDGVDLDVRAGEVHCLLGQNGAGKSTLIKVLAGAHRPDEGEISWAGEPAVLSTPQASISLGISTIYQELDLVAGLGHPLLAEIRSVIYRQSLPLATGNLPVVLSELGEDAVVVGAARLISDAVFAAEHEG